MYTPFLTYGYSQGSEKIDSREEIEGVEGIEYTRDEHAEEVHDARHIYCPLSGGRTAESTRLSSI